MKTLGVIMAICLAAFGAVAAPAPATGHDQVLTRISNETGVPVHTLKKQEAETGLGFGNLEKANLLAKASGHSFREVVSRFKGGEGWGEIAHDAGLNLGKIESEAHRSDNAAQNGRDEEARDDGDRDNRGDGGEARDERDRDDRGDGEEARDDRARDGRGDGDQARDRDERAHDGKDHAQNGAATPGHHRVLKKISNQTGVPVHRLRRQEAKTGLGFGGLEKANLLAKATGHSFRRVVSRFRSGEGWGKIAHDAGLKLGKVVSSAHRSDKAALHAHDGHSQAAHGKSAVAHAQGGVRGRSAVAHGNNSFQHASAVSRVGGHMGTMNSFGHSGLGPGGSGASHGMGHGGHGGGR